MKRIVILGAGGFGQEVAWVIGRLNEVRPVFEILGFADDAEAKREGMCGSYPLLGSIETVKKRFEATGFFCAIGDNRTRQAVTAKMRAAGHEPETVIDPSAVVAPRVEIGPGCYIGIGSVVSVGVRLGEGVFVNHDVTVGHDVTVAGFAQLCPGVRISGGCGIGEGTLVGSNACTIPCVRVGAWATIGAGAAVMREVQEGERFIRLSR